MTILLNILLTIFTVKGVDFEMIPVDGGSFEMGGTIEQRSEFGSTDRPVHKVVVSNYYIGQTEVTRSLWKAVMGEDSGDWLIGDLPVDWVSWAQCQEFIRRLDSITGVRFRLPTEAEWEFAARGGTKAKKQYRYSGGFEYEEYAWLYQNGENRSHPVAKLRPNDLGIYDMSGNVWEWTQDWYADYSAETQIDPLGPDTGSVKVVRGSSWDNVVGNARLSKRDARDPEYSFYDCGFRLAMDGERLKPSLKLKQDSILKVKAAGQNFRMLRVFGANQMMMETEVTQALYNAVMGIKSKHNPSSKTGKNLPQNNLSYFDCLDFIYRLDSLTGMHFRLPTADEWEFAAQGGSKSIRFQEDLSKADDRDKGKRKKASSREIRRKKQGKAALGFVKNMVGSWGKNINTEVDLEDATLSLYDRKDRPAYPYAGSNDIDEVAWYSVNSKSQIHPVKKKSPNELGLYDMTGNVAEWTDTRTEQGEYILRGGSFMSNQAQSEVMKKQTQQAKRAAEHCGLRLVLDIEE